jgi:hypothetical protein
MLAGVGLRLYIVAIALCVIPHVNFATFDKLCTSFVHFLAVYVMCS